MPQSMSAPTKIRKHKEQGALRSTENNQSGAKIATTINDDPEQKREKVLSRFRGQWLPQHTILIRKNEL